jgi:hypothetical protein
MPFLPAIVSSFSYAANKNILISSMKSKIYSSFLCPGPAEEVNCSFQEKLAFARIAPFPI